MVSTSMRTLHIDAESDWGGGERQVSSLCSYLHQWGHLVKIVCRPGSRLADWASREGIETRTVEMRSSLSLPAVAKLRRIIMRDRPDIVHLHTSRAHLLGSAAARLAGAEVVIATRRMDEPIRMTWPNTSAYGKWTSSLVAVSSAVRDVMVHCGVPASRIRVIESGCDVEHFSAAQPDPTLRASLGIDDGAMLVAAVASLAPRKGIDYLIEAAAVLGERGRHLHLAIAGSGPCLAELTSLADRLGVGASFLGFVQDTGSLLASADLFAMPSISEGLGVAALEAMAAGCPVVASSVGGLRESIIDGETGILVSAGDAHSLADGIERIAENPGMAAKLGAAGQARTREMYSLERMARRSEALYLELLSPHYS